MGFLWLLLFIGGMVALGEYEDRARLEAASKLNRLKNLLIPGTSVPVPNSIAVGSIDGDLEDMANEMEKRGLSETAETLRDKSDIVASLRARKLLSPLSDVNDEAWARFVDLFKGKDVGEISPSAHLGLFNIGFRRLGELGLATNVRRVTLRGKQVWGGELKAPMTLKRFLADAAIQYRVFVKDMEDRAALVADHVGDDIDGTTATLSGLLAVAKIAGTNGFKSWASDPAERAKFSNTTAAFRAANGVF